MRADALSALGILFALAACEPGRKVAAPSAAAAPDATSNAAVQPAGPIVSADAAPAVAEKRLVVRLLPLGDVPDAIIETASRGLMAHGPIRTVVEKRLPLPPSTESSQKGRYRSERLLDWMAKLDLRPGGKVLGVTNVDIVAHKGTAPNWGVLGLGSIDGRMCVISTFRMKKKKGGGTVADDVVSERLWKTAIHEVGHTIGIEHCPHAGCLMQDARGTVFTTDEEHDFCPPCAARFARAAAELGEASVSGP
jgi:archaemetzincin